MGSKTQTKTRTAMKDKIVGMIRSGSTLKEATREAAGVSPNTVHRWRKTDRRFDLQIRDALNQNKAAHPWESPAPSVLPPQVAGAIPGFENILEEHEIEHHDAQDDAELRRYGMVLYEEISTKIERLRSMSAASDNDIIMMNIDKAASEWHAMLAYQHRTAGFWKHSYPSNEAKHDAWMALGKMSGSIRNALNSIAGATFQELDADASREHAQSWGKTAKALQGQLKDNYESEAATIQLQLRLQVVAAYQIAQIYQTRAEEAIGAMPKRSRRGKTRK